MENYKHYALAKYKGPSSKHKCPNCGEKTWKPYVDESGTPFSEDFRDAEPNIRQLAETVGRCDNVRKCGWNYTPKQFFADTKAGVPKHRADFKPPPPPEAAKPLRFELVKQSFRPYASTFGCYLRDMILNNDKYSDDKKQKMLARLDEVMSDYWVGATKSHRICYWMIDINGKCRDGKFMAYKSDGHRDHDQHPQWARNSLIRQLYDSKRISLEQKEKLLDQEVIRPYFGTHLLADPRYKHLPVGLVEGEKSCLIAALAFPRLIWIACGMNTFNVSKLWPIIQQKRRLYIFPDVDQLDKWEEATKMLNYPKAYCMGKFIRKKKNTEKDDTGDIFLRIALDGGFISSFIDDPLTRKDLKLQKEVKDEQPEEMSEEEKKAFRLLQLQVAHERLGLTEPSVPLTILFERLHLELADVKEEIADPDYIGF